MKRPVLALAAGWMLAVAAPCPAAPSASGTLRCGWFDNPTPGNAWLIDRDGEWIVGVQGGHQAEGDWPAFEPRDWAATNRSYGHGCACLRVETDAKTHEVRRILHASARPLSTCRKDPAIAHRRPKG